MTDPTTLRKRRDRAYGCFVLLGATALIGLLGSRVPGDVVDPGYVGFFVLIPLTLASAVALVAATVLAWRVGRADPVLFTLWGATVMVVAFVVAAFGDILPLQPEGAAVDVLIAAYGLAALAIGLHWFAVRRARQEPGLAQDPRR